MQTAYEKNTHTEKKTQKVQKVQKHKRGLMLVYSKTTETAVAMARTY